MKIELLDIKLDSLTREEAAKSFFALLEKKSPSVVATVNLEFIAQARQDAEFKRILNQRSILNFIDGVGIILNFGLINAWKPKILVIQQIYVFLQWFLAYLFFPITVNIYKRFIPTTIPGSDFIWDIAKYSSKHDIKLFLLGYSKGLDPNVAEKASLKLQTNIYGLKIAGVYSSTDSITDEKKTCELVKKSGADVLLVGFGSPRQEKWLDRNLGKTGCKIGIGIGGTFDFIAGTQKRAPRWIHKIGFEWLYRLIHNPRRIKRQMALPRIAFLVLKHRLTN